MTVTSADLVAFVLKVLIISVLGTNFVDCQSGCTDVNLNPRVCIPGPENLVTRRAIVVSPSGSTCGSPAARYCRPKPRNGCFMCNATSTTESHGSDKMKDTDTPVGSWDLGFKPTWWQSISWWDARSKGLLIDNTVKVNLTISMNKSYDITGDIKITFYSSKPNALILEKSSDFGLTWTPYRYYADNCNLRFGSSVPTSSANNFQAICQQQPNVAAVQVDSFISKLETATANYLCITCAFQ